jgi:hypothetical protein
VAAPFFFDFIQRLRLPAYVIVAYLGLGSAVEILVGAWPAHFHDVNWRLSVLHSAAGATGTELLALLLLLVIAQLSMSVAGLWTGFCASILVALGYLIGATMFGLDSLQIRSSVPADQLRRFDVTVAWALARFAIVDLVSLTLAACALGAARSLRRESSRNTANRLVVGTSALTPARSTASINRRGVTPRYGESVGS